MDQPKTAHPVARELLQQNGVAQPFGAKQPISRARSAVLLAAALALSGVCSAANVTYEYDAQRRVSKAIYDSGTYVTYSYDLNGNRTTSVLTDLAAPTVPALTATRTTHTTADLSWTASTDSVGVTGYQLERCGGEGCSDFAQIATQVATIYSDTGLTAGTTYRYRVRTSDAAGNLSEYSSVASAVAFETTPPTAPTSLSATAVSETGIDLSWAASTDNVGTQDYRVERCTGASCTSFSQITTRATTSFSDTDRTAGTTYRYQVRASDAAGNLSGYSPIASATALDATAPTMPGAPTFTNLTVTSATANWIAATDNIGVHRLRLPSERRHVAGARGSNLGESHGPVTGSELHIRRACA